MKKVILSLIFCNTIILSYSQNKQEGYSKGATILQGGIQFEQTTTGNVSETNFGFSPKAGYFINDNIVVGINFEFNQAKTVDSITTSNKDVMKFGAFSRYYFTPSNKFSLFTHLGLNYNSMNDRMAKYTESGFDAALSPGISYFLSNHFILEATIGKLGFATSKPNVENAKSTNNVEFNVNLSSVNFGITYKL